MKKTLVIGHFAYKKDEMIGAVVKTRNIYEMLSQKINKKLLKSIDIFGWKTKKKRTFLKIILGCFKAKNIVLIMSDVSRSFMSFIKLLRRLKKRVYYCVIGGDINKRINESNRDYFKYINLIFVENKATKNEMAILGIKNVEIMLNFKMLRPLESVSKHKMDIFSFCTFSRVCLDKGIDDAINAIGELNKRGYRCTLDIYGEIDNSFEDSFKRLLKDNTCCKYRGKINSNNSVDIISQYFCLLFPTRFLGEGIPGTIIDCFAAGVVPISSRYPNYQDILTDKQNSILYDFEDYEGLINAMEYAINHQSKVFELAKGSLRSFSPFFPENAIQPLLNELLK